MESHLEARFWDAFVNRAGLPGDPTRHDRATVLIETIPAAFEMDEILFELREHVIGLNCGRWDYIFSYIKKFRTAGALCCQAGRRSRWIGPLCARTGPPHQDVPQARRIRDGRHGGVHTNQEGSRSQRDRLQKVGADKKSEATVGFDGTWVAHPGLVPVAKDVFDAGLKGPNQLEAAGKSYITREDMLEGARRPGHQVGGADEREP